MIRRLIAWTMPRRLLVAELAELVDERRELGATVLRCVKNCEALRAGLRLERRRLDDLLALKRVGWAHTDEGSFSPSAIDTAPCPDCRPVYLGPPDGASG